MTGLYRWPRAGEFLTDSDPTYIRARGENGIFEVKHELQVEAREK
ncbi:MAG TPA: hypothetical protein VFZ34_08385 [Blastocatellia bacterium]|nr:hypothetical protein [Blastocatellia bacterium]